MCLVVLTAEYKEVSPIFGHCRETAQSNDKAMLEKKVDGALLRLMMSPLSRSSATFNVVGMEGVVATLHGNFPMKKYDWSKATQSLEIIL